MKPEAYKQKNLGYPRETTKARFRVTMPDGSQWDVPVQLIADSRDKHFADEREDTVALCRTSHDSYEIVDWAGNNMNWKDVRRYAVAIPPRKDATDFQTGWTNGEKEFIGEV